MTPDVIQVIYEHKKQLEKAGYNEHYDQQICEKLDYPPTPIENVKFQHNPNWNDGGTIFSIQCAHDVKHPVWHIVRALWIVSAVGGYSLRFFHW